ncbi:hypothetical protein D3C87_347780 [compost metagenome]
MSHTALNIAQHFTLIANEQGLRLCHLQLQKLIYIAHGTSLALLGKPLISDSVVAWQYGPVIPALYQSLKIYLNNPIPPLHGPTPLNPLAQQMLRIIFDTYGHKDGVTLSSLTHQQGTPWHKVWSNHLNGGSTLIPDSMLCEYYQKPSN